MTIWEISKKKKISINEWRDLKANSQKSKNLKSSYTGEAITYYTQEAYMQAADLLKFLISQTDYTHYEYVERLANIYRIQEDLMQEKQLLLAARSSIRNLEFSEGIIKRIDQRLAKIDHFPRSSRSVQSMTLFTKKANAYAGWPLNQHKRF